MKSLYESIVSTNNAGLRSRIIDWADEHMRGGSSEYDLDDQNRIIDKNKHNIILDGIHEPIPSYVKFGYIDTNVFFGDTLNLMSQDQIPLSMATAYIHPDKFKEILHRKLYLRYSLYFQGYNDFHINDLDVYFLDNKNPYKKPNFYFEHTKLTLESLHNIHVVEGNVYKIEMSKTPASDDIIKHLKKLQSKGIEIDEYLDSIFGMFPGLRFVYLSPRKKLEHNPLSKKWMLF